MDTSIDIHLKPVYWKDYPVISIKWDGRSLFEGELDYEHVKTFDVSGKQGIHYFSVDFLNKKDGDTIVDTNKDKAVIIQNISIAGMNFSSFMHKAEYWPVYPENYKQTAFLQKTILKPMIRSNYLGWNGSWVLGLEFPVYSWIHKTENLGWVYEKNL